MNLQIGTILIAKEDQYTEDTGKKCLIKGNEYTVNKIGNQYFEIESELFDVHEWDIDDLDEYFTIKQPDFEVKEEVCYDIPNKNYDSTTDTLVIKLESEIARLKGEVQSWKDSYNVLFRSYEELEKSTPLAVLESTPDQSKRERMAWELYVNDNNQTSMERAFELVDTFLAKSKEVKP